MTQATIRANRESRIAIPYTPRHQRQSLLEARDTRLIDVQLSLGITERRLAQLQERLALQHPLVVAAYGRAA